MRKLPTYFLSVSMLTIIGWNTESMSLIDCNAGRRINLEQATECVNTAINEKLSELFSLAKSKGHLGELNKCAESKAPRGSYFSEELPNFISVFDGVGAPRCEFNQARNKYDCFIDSMADVCVVPRDGTGRLGKYPVGFSIDKEYGEIITFYPYG